MWMELKKGQSNPMLDAAQAISITGGPEKSPEEIALDEMRGEKVADDYRDDPRLKSKKEDRSALVQMNDGSTIPRWLVEGDDVAEENKQGSFESLMGGWAPSSHGQAFDTSAASS
jgi:hypothetical protein